MYDGTRFIRNFAPERCSAPKAANGMAKHKLLRAAILSRPRAWAISFFAANRPITSSARAAADIEKAVRENSKNAARRVGCMDPPISIAPQILRQIVQGRTFRASGEAIRGSNIAHANTVQATRRFWRYCRLL